MNKDHYIIANDSAKKLLNFDAFENYHISKDSPEHRIRMFGKDAFLVASGDYVFHVDEDTFEAVKDIHFLQSLPRWVQLEVNAQSAKDRKEYYRNCIQQRLKEAETKGESVKPILHEKVVAFMAMRSDTAKRLLKNLNTISEPKIIDMGKRFVFEDGAVVNYYSHTDFINEFKHQFPNGFTLKLQDESVKHLKEIEQAAPGKEELLDPNLFTGLVNSSDDLLSAHGLLKAELHLQPSDYGLIVPDMDSYDCKQLSEIGISSEDIAATMTMYAGNGNLNQARITYEINREKLDRLFIEKRPYREVMDLIKKDGLNTDREVIEACRQLNEKENLQQNRSRGRKR